MKHPIIIKMKQLKEAKASTEEEISVEDPPNPDEIISKWTKNEKKEN